eukprot:6213059-Pleurochrysis_carterae.AAC.5
MSGSFWYLAAAAGLAITSCIAAITFGFMICAITCAEEGMGQHIQGLLAVPGEGKRGHQALDEARGLSDRATGQAGCERLSAPSGCSSASASCLEACQACRPCPAFRACPSQAYPACPSQACPCPASPSPPRRCLTQARPCPRASLAARPRASPSPRPASAARRGSRRSRCSAQCRGLGRVWIDRERSVAVLDGGARLLQLEVRIGAIGVHERARHQLDGGAVVRDGRLEVALGHRVARCHLGLARLLHLGVGRLTAGVAHHLLRAELIRGYHLRILLFLIGKALVCWLGRGAHLCCRCIRRWNLEISQKLHKEGEFWLRGEVHSSCISYGSRTSLSQSCKMLMSINSGGRKTYPSCDAQHPHFPAGRRSCPADA